MVKQVNLCLHTGGHAVERDIIDLVKTPDGTDTWVPIAHSELIDSVKSRLHNFNLTPIAESYALHRDQRNMFGLIQVVPNDRVENDDFSLVIGIRNSHCKQFPAGLVIGRQVFVCDNLAFVGEQTIGRKHTRYIHRDLPLLISRAIGGLLDTWNNEDNRIKRYRETPCDNHLAHHLACNALRADGINAQRFSKLLESWHKPTHEEFNEPNLWRLDNAYTEAMKGTSLVELPERNRKFRAVLDTHCGLLV